MIPFELAIGYPVFEDLSAHCKVDWIFSPSEAFGTVTNSEAPDLRYVQVPMFRPFGKKKGMFQCGLVQYILREKPDTIILESRRTFLDKAYLIKRHELS